MSVRSLIQVTKFLLSEGFEFVLTERFCQGDLEEYFGYQRISVLRDIAPSSVQGNVSGRHSAKRQKWLSVSEEPLPKRKVSKGQKGPSEQ